MLISSFCCWQVQSTLSTKDISPAGPEIVKMSHGSRVGQLGARAERRDQRGADYWGADLSGPRAVPRPRWAAALLSCRSAQQCVFTTMLYRLVGADLMLTIVRWHHVWGVSSSGRSVLVRKIIGKDKHVSYLKREKKAEKECSMGVKKWTHFQRRFN